MEKPKLLIFDVNETLLDLSPLKSSINEALKSKSAFDIWFQTLLHYSLVETLTDSYQGFGAIAKAVLKMVLFKFGAELSETEITSILGKIRELPPHSDVPEALARLKKSGFTLVALSNGNEEVLREQLRFAGIDYFFDAIFSIESVRQYKPKASAYQYVLGRMEIPVKDTLMIAAHAWDILGAKRAGLKTAFVEREGKLLYPLGERPELEGETVLDIANKLMTI